MSISWLRLNEAASLRQNNVLCKADNKRKGDHKTKHGIAQGIPLEHFCIVRAYLCHKLFGVTKKSSYHSLFNHAVRCAVPLERIAKIAEFGVVIRLQVCNDKHRRKRLGGLNDQGIEREDE